MREVNYPAVICGNEGAYGILFPDFLGCASAGETRDEVLQMGAEALQFHIEGMSESNETIPEPGSHTLESVAAMLLEDNDDLEETDLKLSELVAISARVPEPHDHVAIDVPSSLARDIDEIDRDRSRFIIEAARRELLRRKAA